MATLKQIDPTATAYPTLKQVDYRKTHISSTQLASSSQPYGADAALDAFYKRKTLHRLLDQRCADENIVMDRAARLHAALDRYLDKHRDSAEEEEETEPPEESGDDDEPDEVERTAKQHSGKDSIAMDAHKCSACKIADGKPVPAGIAATTQSIIDFWKKEGIHLREA